MLFASPSFLFFFLPACLALYFAMPSMRAKNLLLLAASLVFYGWGEPVFVLLMAAMTGFNYLAARAIDGREGSARKAALAAGAGVNLAVLAVFKYADFAIGTLDATLGPLGVSLPRPHIPLPLGVSFFTFHALSYLIDVFRRRFAANRNLEQVALYIAFFPQLIAGPIVRYKTIARRLVFRRHSLGRASAGLRMFIIGLGQKLLLADQLAPLADAVFDHAHAPGLASAWVGVVAYALQIYFDFAGYSNMAIGLGVVFGFSLPRNFNLPYASRSITEFWRRWHISLSSWFRDYLYIPLGGNRGGRWRTWRNLVVVFLLCGLWHGASWTFVLWGAWHGLFLVVERAGLGRGLARLPAPLAWAYAMAAVLGGWVLFRAPDLAAAGEVWRGLVGLNGAGGLSPDLAASWQTLHAWLLPLAAVLAVAPVWRPKLRGWPRTRLALDHAAVAALLVLAISQVAAGAYSPFLYFRF